MRASKSSGLRAHRGCLHAGVLGLQPVVRSAREPGGASFGPARLQRVGRGVERLAQLWGRCAMPRRRLRARRKIAGEVRKSAV